MWRPVFVLTVAAMALAAPRADAQIAISCSGQTKSCPVGWFNNCRQWSPCRKGSAVPKHCSSFQCVQPKRK